MQRLLTVLVLAAMATVASTPALAGNQEAAEQIAKTLRGSGKLSNYKIEVRYQQGTVWLKGNVQDQSQMNTALRLALQTSDVNRVVNDLAIGSPEPVAPALANREPAHRSPPANMNSTMPRETMPREMMPREIRPQRLSAAQWLKKIVSGGGRQPKAGSRAQPISEQSSGRAQRVPSSFTPAPVRQVAATQPVAVMQAMPRTMNPQPVGRPMPIAYTRAVEGAPGAAMGGGQMPGRPIPAHVARAGGGVAPARYDQPRMPNYSWPSYAAYPNYAGLTYPRQYSPTAWPFIGPFYPYPQVPLGWRKVTLEWDDGWWMLDFRDSPSGRR